MDLVYTRDLYGRSGWKDAMLFLTMVSFSSAFLGFVVSSDSPLSLSCSGSGDGVRSPVLLVLLTEPCPCLVDETAMRIRLRLSDLQRCFPEPKNGSLSILPARLIKEKQKKKRLSFPFAPSPSSNP